MEAAKRLVITQKWGGTPVVSTPAYLENELHHFGVDQPVDGLAVDVRDEVTGAQTGLLGGAAILDVLPDTTNNRRRSTGTTRTSQSPKV